MKSYEFLDRDEELIRLCTAARPDFEKIREAIDKGADVNALNGDGECLFELLRNEEGKKLLQGTKLLLQLGFDVDRLGFQALHRLWLTFHHRHGVDAAKLLLEAGTHGTADQWEALLESVGTEESFLRCCEGDHASENNYYACYEMLERASKGEPFSHIGVWEDCIGLTVKAILADAEEKPAVVPMGNRRYALKGRLLLDCGEKTVLLEAHPNIYLCRMPQLRYTQDLTDVLAPCIGQRILRVDFEHKEFRKGTGSYRQPNIFLRFSGGSTLHCCTNFGEVPKEDTDTIVELLPTRKKKTQT